MSDWEATPEFVQEMQAIFQITEEDEKALAEVKDIAQKYVEPFLDAFYTHLLSFPAPRAILYDESVIKRVKEAQRGYYLSLFTGKHDREYFQSRMGIGYTHDRIGLEPQWYMGCYAFYLARLISWIEREPGPGKDSVRVWSAIAKVICLDIALAWGTYYRAREETLQRRLRELEAQYNLSMKVLNERAEIINSYNSRIKELEGTLQQIHQVLEQTEKEGS